ncbi:hypothetical protein G7062_07390 [Erysipelothrix sp. HDW6C]|uniref:hypothetical protein n=1 Tax=Erysipelothrix sp. HDW6C TaxID=2714930 RepID=UPI00140ADD54|nr:hypothetical protein [Erysipelothrix sp. HDW6C]QIK70119.1 hypothetical protein G7062_07390 [Erysipelothrix sp. HDW6C]
MRKRILFIAFTAVALVATFVVLYRQFGSETVAMSRTVDTVDSVITHSIKLSEISEFAKENPGEHVFLLRDGNADSDYVIDTVLTPLAMEQAERPTPNIVSVDMTSSQEMTVTRLKNMFSVDSYPAFIYASYDTSKNTLVTKSSISFDTNKPMTSDELRTWFFNNKLWTGPYKS